MPPPKDLHTATLPAKSRMVTSTPYPEENTRHRQASTLMTPSRQRALGTQSLERPVRVNKLVLRVPSAASEYQHRRVIHSVCVPALEGSEAKSDGVETREVSTSQTGALAGVPTITCETSKRLLPDDFKYPSSDFTPGQVISSIPLSDPEKRLTPPGDGHHWRNGHLLPGGISDAGSASLSNFSSGDGLSTFSQTSHPFSYFSSGDGLSTPTQMGSTTRLVHAHKTPVQARCSRCLGAENVTTALSVLSFAGTLGNLLRLPRMVYFHGGGAFLLVYVLITLVFGIPLTFLEIGLGQFCQHGAVKLWRAVNLFRGVGYAKAFLSFALAVSFSTQVSSALALLVYTSYESQSFSDCDNMPSTENGSFVMAVSSQQSKQICLLQTVLAPATNQAMWFGIKVVFLILIWALVFICVMKRSVTYRRVMYFLFPGFFALIAALLVEGSNHPNNASTGLDKVFTFDWTALGDIQVWYFAIVQMFFSLQLGLGNISTCAGRIYPKSNAFWTALCLVGSSLVMGVASIILVYIWLGALDEQTPYDVPETFVLSVIYQLSASTAVIWPCLAYLLVLIAGISSLIPLIYTVLVAGAVETKRKWRWRHINASICLAACFFSAISLIPGKLTMAHILEHYLVSHGVVFLTFLELIGFAVVYGCSNLYNDLEFVIGSKLSSMWKSLWLVTPCVLLVVEICAICLLPLDSEAGQNSDPLWETCLGWALYFTCWMIVLIIAFYQVCIQVDYNIAQKFVSALKPSRNWGPVDPIYRHCWVQWRNRYNLTGARDFTLKRRGTRDYTHHARTTPAKSDTGSLNWPQSRH